MSKNRRIKQIVTNSITEVNLGLSKENQLENSTGTRLFGGNSDLDSLGLVNLIVAIEQHLEEEFNITISLADDKAMSQKHSPFKTVGTLVDYIEMLLDEI